MFVEATVPAFTFLPVLSSVFHLFADVQLCFLHHGCGFDQIRQGALCRITFHIPTNLFIHYKVDLPPNGFINFYASSKALGEALRSAKPSSYIDFSYDPRDHDCLCLRVRNEHNNVETHLVRLNCEPTTKPALSACEERVMDLTNSFIRDGALISQWFPFSHLRQALQSVRSQIDRMDPPPCELMPSADFLQWKLNVPKKSSFNSHEYLFTVLHKIDDETLFLEPFSALFWPILEIHSELSKRHSRIVVDARKAAGGFAHHDVIQILFHMDWNLRFEVFFVHSRHSKLQEV